MTELKKIEGVVGVHAVYGVYDVVAEVEAETEQMLKEIVFSRIRMLKHVRYTLTLTTILKSRPAPLRTSSLLVVCVPALRGAEPVSV